MGNKDDKNIIADDDIIASTDATKKDAEERDNSFIVKVKNDSSKNSDVLDSYGSDTPTEAENLSKELDRVESIDTGSLTGRATRQLKEATGNDEPLSEEVDAVEGRRREAEMTRPLDLDPVSIGGQENRNPKEVGLATVGTALNSHHSFQKQHQKRRILQVLLLLFVVIAIATSMVAGYFYYQLSETNNKVTQVESDLAQAKAQQEVLLAQVSEQTAVNEDEAATLAMGVIDELGVSYPASETTDSLIYGYGGTGADGVSYVHFTTRALADYQETIAGKKVFPCGISEAAPVTIVRGTQAQLTTLSATQPLSEQRQIGKFFYAISKPAQLCSATQGAAVQEAQAAIVAHYKTFEEANVETQAMSEANVPASSMQTR